MGEMSNPIARTQSAKLRMFRRQMGLKQWALADMLGVDQSTVSRWERGSRPIEDRIWCELRNIGKIRRTVDSQPLRPAGADPDTHWPALLRHYRAVRKISQEQLSEILGFTADSVRRWETGQWKPSLGSQIRLNSVILACAETTALLHRLMTENPGASGSVGSRTQQDVS
ncbi:MAG: helix-turn-helix domain-containing protein [Alphaproteobacteria bacterium]|nr:helix-turn-helix domain-containing protein [Alphaproteobacteria bacterium]